MITEMDILTAVRDVLKNEFKYKVYLDDIQENFVPPAFFLQVITTESDYSKTLTHWDCSLFIDFVPKQAEKAARFMYEIKAKLREMFVKGFQVKDRWIHVTSISAETSGENKDFLECKLEFSFKQAIPENETQYIMQNFYDRYY